MAQVELIMPRMGESIMEATVLKWLKNVGDPIEEEESVLEIATDKVDSEVPSPVSGVLAEILCEEGDVVAVGAPVAIITTEGEAGGDAASPSTSESTPAPVVEEAPAPAPVPEANPVMAVAPALTATIAEVSANANGAAVSSNFEGRFYSPLVLNMARREGVSMEVLNQIPGTGKGGRLTKKDMLKYIADGKPSFGAAPIAAPVAEVKTAIVSTPPPAVQVQAPPPPPPKVETKKAAPAQSSAPAIKAPKVSYTEQDTVVEMDRMRKMIADHMVMSKHVSPHVTSFIEVDVTPLVQWRNNMKNDFFQREGEKFTFTPVFVEAVCNALKMYPQVNASVDGYNMILRKDINIGMATALPSGNLIVPVLKTADRYNLGGLAKSVNDLAARARINKLKPEEIQGGTFTVSNIGGFGSMMGTPIINQPQVAILAIGAIRKKPAVLETEEGDVIAIRHQMIMSLSYDHRIIDGALGSKFLKQVADNLEQFDTSRTV